MKGELRQMFVKNARLADSGSKIPTARSTGATPRIRSATLTRTTTL